MDELWPSAPSAWNCLTILLELVIWGEAKDKPCQLQWPTDISATIGKCKRLSLTAATHCSVLLSILTNHCRTYGSKNIVMLKSSDVLDCVKISQENTAKTRTRDKRPWTSPRVSSFFDIGQIYLELEHQGWVHSSRTRIIAFARVVSLLLSEA